MTPSPSPSQIEFSDFPEALQEMPGVGGIKLKEEFAVPLTVKVE